jgi:acyl-coenzyme A synthetase/AMP-(fatty) acid ligase
VNTERLLPPLFAGAAARHPAAPAVTQGGETTSYATLAAMVQERAQTLAPHGHSPDGQSVTVLVVDDTLASVVDLLAALTIVDVVVLGDREHSAAGSERVGAYDHDIGAVPSVVFPTSGSTGTPKLVCHSHTTLALALRNTLALRNLQLGIDPPTAATALADALSTLIADGHQLTLTVVPGMPLWSISGFNVLELTLFTGGHLVLCDTSSASDTLDAIERMHVTNIGVPPIMLRGLAREQRRRPRNVDSLLLIGIGAGPVDAAFAREAEAMFGCHVAAAYGSTEVGGAALMPAFDDPTTVRTGSVGRALPGVEIAVDGTGELLVRTDSIMRGYIDATGRLVPHDPDAWYRTGDLAHVDDAGNAHIIGRIDDQILRGGRLIDPAAIEAALERHPAVQRAVVVGVPSRVPGEQDVWAACVCSTPFSEGAPAELWRLCRDTLPPSERPRRIECVPEIPLRRDGSPHRAGVRDLFRLAGAKGGGEDPPRDADPTKPRATQKSGAKGGGEDPHQLKK